MQVLDGDGEISPARKPTLTHTRNAPATSANGLWDDGLVFDVFVEGPVDPSPGAVRKLAETIAGKYGLSAEDFATRLARGRVRVKAKVDRHTADAYVKSLA